MSDEPMKNETETVASEAMISGKKEDLGDIVACGLRTDAIDAMPVNTEWDSETFSEGWDFWEAAECDECDEIVLSSSGEEKCANGHYAPVFEGPMMSYYYPLPDDTEGNEDFSAEAIASLPLCVVRVGSQWGLALTGGGMDLSWEICEAYIRLGYYPPVHFGRLPQMAGTERDPNAPVIASATFDALQIRARWTMNKANEIARLWDNFFPPGTSHKPESAEWEKPLSEVS